VRALGMIKTTKDIVTSLVTDGFGNVDYISEIVTFYSPYFTSTSDLYKLN
jgi:hypothetical protein